jgi:aminomuconate-semialdehyde/2-hydroxymuconate-6-semialdehyde dehydrogenase
MTEAYVQLGAAGDAAKAGSELQNFIGGRWVRTRSTFENRNPATGALVGLVHEAGSVEVDAAVAAARAALRGPWGKMSVERRTQMLHAVADEITRRFDDFVAAEIADSGMPHHLASHIDIPRGAANFKVFADLIKNVPTETFTMANPDGSKVLNYAVRTPRGVIAVICPWNLPLLLMTWKVGPALACGNAVVVKPSEETPSTATLLAEVFETVGVPEGVFNVVHGFGPDSAGELLARHPGVDGITFTGETRTGEAIMASAAKGVRPVSFELGGKNPAVIFADCDMGKTIAGITRAAFSNTGQVCLGSERVFVQRPIFDEFVARLKAAAEGMKLGDPNSHSVNMGPLISQEHRRKVLSYYERAKAEGATIVTGGGVPVMPPELESGSWVEPTIWTGLPDSSVIMTEEIFGPCCHVTPFDTEEEVIVRANATAYGLAATVWTTDLATAHRMGEALEVGICWINSWFLRDLRTAFGGAKQSGIGREGGVHSLEFYTEIRNVCINLG